MIDMRTYKRYIKKKNQYQSYNIKQEEVRLYIIKAIRKYIVMTLTHKRGSIFMESNPMC